MFKLITYLVVLPMVFSGTVFAQVMMTINGDPVGSGDVYQYTAQEPAGNSGAEQMNLEVQNISGASMTFYVERCKIVDVPGWEVNSTVWAGADDPFGGIHYSNSTMTGDCWTTLHSVDASAGSSVQFVDYLDATDISCAIYRYYIWNGAVLEDSVDVEFCRISLVEINELDGYTVEIFPNPVKTKLSVRTEDEEKRSVVVLSVSGELILSSQMKGDLKLDLETFTNGVYILVLTGRDGHSVRKKFVVNH